MYKRQAIDFLAMTAVLSVGLGLFNLIPFPPLDGSKVVEGFLPDRIYYGILRYERWGMLLLMAILWTGVLSTPLALSLIHISIISVPSPM